MPRSHSSSTCDSMMDAARRYEPAASSRASARSRSRTKRSAGSITRSPTSCVWMSTNPARST